MDLEEHLFRRESAKLIAALTRIFGVHNLALAEDVVQDALCRALEVWKQRGVPENPSAWLMATAKNRALDVVRRERTARTFAPELGRLLESEWTSAPIVAEAFEPHAIRDDELRMMFTCCHPQLSEEAQIPLILHLSCGFGVKEIASAFLAGESAIEKRIVRAKKVLASSKELFDVHGRRGADLAPRLTAVHRAIYLLFNEGYHAASGESAIRAELCGEAIRLAERLLDHEVTATPTSHALAALLCLHAARLASRVDEAGNLAGLSDQDRSRWDVALIAKGLRYLDQSARGERITEYHVEAAIASLHSTAPTAEATDWGTIVGLYDTLLSIRPSPVVALNRAIAVGRHDGAARGLEEIQAIEGRDRLAEYPFYEASLGELELQCGHVDRARTHFEAALACARTPMERAFLERRLRACEA